VPDSDSLKVLSNNLGVRVEFPGFVSGQHLFDRIQMARAVVLPSEWYENAPISVLEAYACGKPVIGAGIGGIPELIESDRGATFDAFSVDSLADALSEFQNASNQQLRSMGQAGRDYVLDVHSEGRYRRNLGVVYDKLLGIA
jgi:glycosyltransferase involved in cell wall biosynthesis|tara:strand:+ start:1735 stop:2160 length:426 start_codon:yes stop_codon:yes gene_type:complete